MSMRRDERGIVLAIVLVLIFALITAVYAFQRRSVIDTTISRNRIDAAEADALARGGLRIAEALLMVVRAKTLGAEAAGGGDAPPSLSGLGSGGGGSITADALWQGLENFPIELDEDRRLEIAVEDEGARLNLNSLVPISAAPDPDADPRDDDSLDGADDEAVEYLGEVLDYIVSGMDEAAGETAYDPQQIAENILDFIDPDTTAINGRSEDDYYRRQDPPYSAWNRPFVSVDQIGLVEGVDPPLLDAMREYLTVHPIGDRGGINLNRAEPWVLKLVYSGTSGNRRLLDDATVKDIVRLRRKGKLVCDDAAADPRCVTRNDVGNGDLGNGSLYPERELPARPSVFRVVSSARVGNLTRRLEAVYDTRPIEGPQLLSWRRLRGND